MYQTIAHVLHAIYLALPAVILVIALFQQLRRGRPETMAVLVLNCVSAVFIAAGAMAGWHSLIGGQLTGDQFAATWYFVLGVLCLMKGIRWGITRLMCGVFGLRRSADGRIISRGFRRIAADFVQTTLIMLIGIPLVAGVVATRRIRTGPISDPDSALDFRYDDVLLTALDGGNLRGWWVPVQEESDEQNGPKAKRWGKQTVLICRGLGEDRNREMALIWLFASDGYNVLIIDPRGQGQSDGQWGSFGAQERLDVLGAVRWLKATRGDSAEMIFGLGLGTGGAAMIAAAAEQVPIAQQLDAIAVTGTCADLTSSLLQALPGRQSSMLNWITRRVVMPFASAQVGVDLGRFAPADLVRKIWPRPVLIIHGRRDQMVPFELGWDLFESADQPKQSLWVDADHTGTLKNPRTAQRLREFFATAKKIPVI